MRQPAPQRKEQCGNIPVVCRANSQNKKSIFNANEKVPQDLDRQADAYLHGSVHDGWVCARICQRASARSQVRVNEAAPCVYLPTSSTAHVHTHTCTHTHAHARTHAQGGTPAAHTHTHETQRARGGAAKERERSDAQQEEVKSRHRSETARSEKRTLRTLAPTLTTTT